MRQGWGAYLRVGLLVLIGTAAIVGFVLFLSGGRVSAGAHYETYYTESVQGLDVGAPVKFRGVSLGQVNEIGLVAATYLKDQPLDVSRVTSRLVLVRFAIDPTRVGRLPDEQSAVQAGLRARLASQGLTGLSYIELDFVDPARFPPDQVPWTPRDTYIPSVPSTIAQVQDSAQALLAKINKLDLTAVFDSLQVVLADVHGQLTTGSAAQVLAQTAELMGSLRQTVDKADLPGLAAELRQAANGLQGTLNSKDTRALLASATKAAERFGDAAAKLPVLIASLQAVVQRTSAGTADLQADLAPVLRDARVAAQNLRDTTDALRGYPASVLLGGPPPREGTRR